MAEKKRAEMRANLVASASTGATTMLITNPIDTLRCRWQVAPQPAGTLKTFAGTLLREEGLWSGLWRVGLAPNVVAMAIAIGGRNGLYPTMREAVGAMLGSTEKVGPQGMFVAGLMAGMTG